MTVPFKPEPWLAEWIGRTAADGTSVARKSQLPPVPVLSADNSRPGEREALRQAYDNPQANLGRALQAGQVAAEFLPSPFGDVASAGAAVRELRAGNKGYAALSAAGALPIIPSLAAAKGAKKLRSAAIRAEDGRIFTGPTHGHAFMEAEDAGAAVTGHIDDEGFIDPKGKYITRRQAKQQGYFAKAEKDVPQTVQLADQKEIVDELPNDIDAQIAAIVAKQNVPPLAPAARKAAKLIGKDANDDVLSIAEAMIRNDPMPRVTQVDAEKAGKMAKVYEGLPKMDPEAKSAYDLLNEEVAAQAKAIQDAGYKFEFVDSDPYENSAAMMKDVRENKRLKVFKTPAEGSFHPYMTPEQNDTFRAVHDWIAHAGPGNQFGPIGEENAYRMHAATLSPQAQRALASETRGQNSWVNFGPNAHLPVKERPFAEQKAALWPEEYLGDYDKMPAPEPPEKIVSASSRLKTKPLKEGGPTHFEGLTHGDAYDAYLKSPEGQFAKKYGLRRDDDLEEGFLTNTGRFVTREEALEIAKAQQQWSGLNRMKLEPSGKPGLMSEGLKGWADPSQRAKMIEAPNVITSGEGDAIPMDVSIDPAGVDASRPPVYRPPRADLSVLDPLKRRIRDVYTPAAEKGLKEDPKGAAWYDLSPLKKIFEQESPTGAEDFRTFTRLLGPTSAGTNVPQNIRQASLFYQLHKAGELTPEAIRGKKLVIPPGYGNRLNIREPLARVVEHGGLDPLKTPKTARYSTQLGGENWGGVTLDRHVGYNIGVPGDYVGAAYGDVGATNARVGKGRGFPTGKYRETKQVDTSPENRHYAEIEDAMIREAEKLGVHPTVYQAAGWVGNAGKTGVADARHPLEIINEKLKDTAKKYGYKNSAAALRAFIRGETPLWALGGGLLGVSAAERAGAGLLGDPSEP